MNDDTTSITEPATVCEEVHAWVHADSTRGFEMRCGDTYDNLQPDEVAAARAGHVCGDENEPAPAPVEPDRPRWPQLQPGEQVTLTIDDALVGYVVRPGRATFELAPLAEGEHPTFLDVPIGHPQVKVSRAAPVDEVPQPGEIWTDRVAEVYLATAAAWLVPSEGAGLAQPWQAVHTGPTGPIRRLMSVDDIASYR